MSICNRYHITLKKNNMSWYLIYILDELPYNLDIGKILYPQTIKNISQIINVLEIHIYILNDTQRNQVNNIFCGLNVTIYTFNHIFDLFKYYDDNKINAIYFTNNTGCISNDININFDKMYTTYYSEYDNIYNNILDKYNIKEIIDPKIFIVPHIKNNKIYFDLCKKIFDKINSMDVKFKTNLAMTFANNKLDNNIVSINNLLDQKKFIIYNSSIINHKDLYESIILQNNSGNYYNYNVNNNYIFYPYFDFNLAYQKINNIDSCYICNTNGFGTIEQSANPFSNIYKRFNNLLQGSFLFKKENMYNIPKIIHHIWINNDPIINYVDLWKKMLKEPWEYKIWDNNNINDFMNNSRWKDLYNKSSDKYKYIILSLAILEKYGGIIIDSYCVPLKIIPDEILSNKFFISFENENYGTNLSFKIIGSICGPLDEKNKFKDPYVARKPFDGINNFFRSKKENTADIFFQDLFIKIHNINIEHNDPINEIQKLLINNSDVFIYPSYFFNLNTYIYPKKLTYQSILINLHKLDSINPRIKTNVSRNYTITHEGIINRLKENPKDRLKNINKL
uniref:Putative glycosyl transferase n=1 Tax=Moumouvirus sp. 'Monve' TaxID=1128131 RepID=H2EEY4_9VIRU|nr:putative glycosyl transferase [Moumouvirus Monve]